MQTCAQVRLALVLRRRPGWPQHGRNGSTSRYRPKVGRFRAGVGRNRKRSGRVWPEWGETWNGIRQNLGRFGKTPALFGRYRANCSPVLIDVGQAPPELCETRSGIGQVRCRGKFVRFGHIGTIWVRMCGGGAPLYTSSKTGGGLGGTGAPEVRRGVAQESVPPALFDATEPKCEASGGSGARVSRQAELCSPAMCWGAPPRLRAMCCPTHLVRILYSAGHQHAPKEGHFPRNVS